MSWKGIVGRPFSPAQFDEYCHDLIWDAWRPTLIVLHNTAVPTLAQRPGGFTEQHIKNLEIYYRDTQKWSAGPHLFVDDKNIWVFTPLTMSGVHSPSWNKLSIGVEMLGDYNREEFESGRGHKVKANTELALASICAVLGIPPEQIRLHKEDPKTTHDCPGKKVVKSVIISDVKEIIEMRHSGEHNPLSGLK
jgi:N-acetylmuramoyl-L-alanine amidase CwlA